VKHLGRIPRTRLRTIHRKTPIPHTSWLTYVGVSGLAGAIQVLVLLVRSR
jgi:hypothetical protein